MAEILAVINTDNNVAKIRPELAVALAQFPEFWTAGKKAEANIANDNKKTAPAAKKASPGPSF